MFDTLTTKARSCGSLATAGATLIALAAGCASDPPQALTTQLAVTDTSIGQAEQGGATENGLRELQQAKDKRAAAERALRDKDYDEAMRLAQQAQLDAQYAARKSQAEQAHKSAAEVERAHESLRREAERTTNEVERDTVTR